MPLSTTSTSRAQPSAGEDPATQESSAVCVCQHLSGDGRTAEDRLAAEILAMPPDKRDRFLLRITDEVAREITTEPVGEPSRQAHIPECQPPHVSNTTVVGGRGTASKHPRSTPGPKRQPSRLRLLAAAKILHETGGGTWERVHHIHTIVANALGGEPYYDQEILKQAISREISRQDFSEILSRMRENQKKRAQRG